MRDHRTGPAAGQRGPAEHVIRERILEAAEAYFSHYGYSKTTVADLAESIGFSKTYIYKFFDSKHSIGEAICNRCLGTLIASVSGSVSNGKTATDRCRTFIKALAAHNCELFRQNGKLHDIAARSFSENWPSAIAYAEQVATMIDEIIREGRASREFERKTPIDEAVRAIIHALQPFMSPAMLRYNIDAFPDGASEVANLVLRSLAP